MGFRSVSLLRYSDILSEAGSFFLPETPGMPRLHYPVSFPAVHLNLFPEFLAVPVDITDLYIDGILKVLDHDINRLGAVLDEMAAIAGDSVKVTVTVSADEAALPHDVKKYL